MSHDDVTHLEEESNLSVWQNDVSDIVQIVVRETGFVDVISSWKRKEKGQKRKNGFF